MDGRLDPLKRLVWIRGAVWLVVTIVVWIAHFDPPTAAAAPELDPSWHQALGWQLVHGLRAGVDVVFPYGPLGYFFDSPYDPDLYWTKVLGWELALEAVLAGFVAWGALRPRRMLERALAVVALVLLFGGNDSFTFLALCAITLWRLERPDRPLAARAATCFLFALLALVKFTYFAHAAAAAALIVVYHLRARSWRSALVEIALHAGALAVTWVAIGQSLADLPRWIASTSATARGHNEAMSLSGRAFELRLLAAMLALALFVLAREAFARPRALGRALAALVVLLTLAAAAKAGFVRHTGTSQTFFAVASAGLYFLPARERTTRTRAGRALDVAASVARAAVVVLAVFGFHSALGARPGGFDAPFTYALQHYEGRIGDLSAMRTHEARVAAESREVAAKHDLSAVRARVGTETIDAFVYADAALFLNGLSWRPRPVFQSYCAYTRELCELNARFLESDRAPRFALFRFETTDMRMPGLEDGPALRVLLRDYEPVLVEEDFLLLERRAAAPLLERERDEVVLERTIGFAEALHLPAIEGRALRLDVDVRYTPLGRVAAALLRSPKMYALAETEEGSRVGFRVSPGMLDTGVLVRPFLDGQQRWIEAFCGVAGAGLARVTLRIQPGSEWFFEPKIRVRVVRCDGVVPDLDRARLAELSYSMFATPPREVEGMYPVSRERLHDGDILVVHAPAEMRFDVEAGEHRVTGRYGVKPEAVLDRCTDGVAFAIVSRTRDKKETVVWRRYVDPTDEPADRGYQELDESFTVEEPGTLILRTSVGPKRNGNCDWAFWANIRVE